MIFTLICKDRPGHVEVRLANRPAHVDYLMALDKAGKLRFGGPFLNEDGKPIGSMVAVEAEDRAEAEKIAAGDPYAKAGLFDHVEILPWNWVFKAPEAK